MVFRVATETYCPTGECVWDNIGGKRAEPCGPCEEHFGSAASLEAVREAMSPTCEICGGPVHDPYYWNDDRRLPMHRDMTLCQSADPLLFVAFINRNVEYLNGRGEPVMLKEATT